MVFEGFYLFFHSVDDVDVFLFVSFAEGALLFVLYVFVLVFEEEDLGFVALGLLFEHGQFFGVGLVLFLQFFEGELILCELFHDLFKGLLGVVLVRVEDVEQFFIDFPEIGFDQLVVFGQLADGVLALRFSLFKFFPFLFDFIQLRL